MPHSNHALEPLLRKLMRWSNLDAADQQAVLDLPHEQRRIERGSYIVREGDEPSHACLLLSGFASRHKIVGNGGRQILSVHVAGDLVDLQNVLLRTADHSVQAMTGGVIAAIPREAIKSLMHSRPLVADAMWYDTLVDASIHREWIANLGRRSARTAMSHLLCEFGVRLQEAGLGSLSRYEMPMTQEELADALGLTSVHVNRTLMRLKRDGLAQRRGTLVYIDDWTKLAIEGDFTPQYLHLQDERGRAAGSRNVEV